MTISIINDEKKKKVLPNEILHLIMCFGKEVENDITIPICLFYQIARYFVAIFEVRLFSIKFHKALPYGGGAVTSISATFFITNRDNDSYCKLFINVGSDIEIEISLLRSEIKAFGNKYPIKCVNGDVWNFQRSTGSRSLFENIKVTVRLNRCTLCECSKSNGSIDLFFRNNIMCNNKTDGQSKIWTDDGYVGWKSTDGVLCLSLQVYCYLLINNKQNPQEKLDIYNVLSYFLLLLETTHKR